MTAEFRPCSKCGLSKLHFRSRETVCDDCRGRGRHNEGSCDLCTGYHDAEEAAFMNKRRTPPTTDTEPATLRQAAQAVADYSWGLHLAGTANEQEAIGLIERLRAALAAERASGGLDVERWARAMARCGVGFVNMGMRVVPISEVVPAIAAEYARLATPQPGEDLSPDEAVVG